MARRDDVRPQNPDFLTRAVRQIFGAACLRCGTDRPRAVMAHIHDWPKIRETAQEQIWGTPPPPETIEGLRQVAVKQSEDTSPALARMTQEHRYSLFHDLGNVLPLCPNCHALFDDKSYPEVTEAEIRALRDDAVRRPEVLVRVIDFIHAELRGRVGRCTHEDENGNKEHTHRTNIMALGSPLTWVMNGYAAGLDLGVRAFVVACRCKTQHHHVALDQGAIDLCVAPLRDCKKLGRVPVPRNTEAP
ncbi:HNH endonuclease [Streptomyces sp. NPDC091204]|uniref:HNH endonuclease n=1 Tax=Streptomyces sp. NPDC091204 TaxID=3155299 RepID=UPI00343E93F8